MKKFLWGIISILILVVIIIVLVILPKEENNKEEKEISIEDEVKQELLSSEELGIVVPDNNDFEPEYRDFYTVLNCISQYYGAININNSSYYGKDEEGNIIQNATQEDINEKIQGILQDKASVDTINEENIFVPVDMKLKKNGAVQSYAVYGIVANINMEYIKEQYFIVNLDTVNKTFSIEKIVKSVNSIDDISVNELQSIEKNSYNLLRYQEVDEQFKYKKMFENLKQLMLIKPEIAYQYLDEDYKAQRFGSYERFKEYVENNREHIIGITPQRYNFGDESSILLLKDQYDVWYEFKITGTMKYTAKIDNYIVLNDMDIEQYKKYSTEKKAEYNINRWIKMINSKDYEIAYNYLDETFKKENYPTKEQFAKFMEEKYTNWYDNVEITTQKEGNIYTAKVELNVEGEEFTDKYITIIMRLDEGTDFTMSFDAN